MAKLETTDVYAWIAARLGILLALGSVVVTAVLVVQAAASLTSIGVSTDEPAHVERTTNWIQTGWYLPTQLLDNEGNVADGTRTEMLHTYGAAFSLSAHVAAVLIGVEEPAAARTTAVAYTARHLAVLLLALGGSACVGYATSLVTGRRSIAIWTATALLTMPLWTGYGLFAVKDIPSGAGWTMVTTGCIAVFCASNHRHRYAVGGLLVYSGVWFSFGTRTGLWVPLAGTIGVAGALLALRHGDTRERLHAALTLGTACVLASLTVAGVHYRNASAAPTWLWSGFTRTADFDEATRQTLTAGELLPTKPPWWYLPAWLGASTPVLLGVMTISGVSLLGLSIIKAGTTPRQRLGGADTALLLWVVQAFVLPLAAIAIGSTMYGGLRHHVYAFPAMAALAGYALHRATLGDSSVRRRAVVGIVAAAAVVAPTIDQLTLRPFAYTYKNALAGHIDTQWETDLHWVSAREALTHLPAGSEILCYRESTLNPAEQPTITNCIGHPQISPFLDEVGTRASDVDTADRVWVIARFSNGSPPYEGCAPVANVTRQLRFQSVTMSYVLSCDPSAIGSTG